MRHRVTYIHPSEGEGAIETLNSTYVNLKPLKPAREDRFTYDIDEFSHIKTLRVQITKTYEPTDLTSAFSYNYQYGLHIYVVPKGVNEANERENFDKQLLAILLESFGKAPGEAEWIPSLNSLYFHTSEILETKKEAFQGKVNNDWSALDFYYNEGTVTIKTLEPTLNNLIVDGEAAKEYTEVGVFGLDQHTTRDDIILTGLRVVFNDEEVEENEGFVHKTMFHIKPRHRRIESVPIDHIKNGLHPVVTIKEAPEYPSDDDITDCKLFLYWTLEKSVFLDPYQLPELINLLLNYGTKNLELPEYSVPTWGNEILMEIENDASFPLDLTLHSRYQLPDAAPKTNVSISKPVLFYGCEAGVDEFLLANSPFDNRRPVGGTFEKFFTDDTIFYHALDREPIVVSIPNAQGSCDAVNILTFMAVLFGVGMVLKKIFTPTVDRKKKNE